MVRTSVSVVFALVLMTSVVNAQPVPVDAGRDPSQGEKKGTGAVAQAEAEEKKPVWEAAYGDFLSTDAIGAKEFIKAHAEWDGRGVVIAVLDTGVDMTVPGLTKTSTGEVKVIQALDFSGQGAVHLEKGKEVMERDEPVLKAGRVVVRGHKQLSPMPEMESLMLGALEESRFAESTVSDINRNGRRDDKFAILLGKVQVDGKEKWLAWVDVDGDGQLDDEKPMEEYAASQTPFYFGAAGEGEPRAYLAMALQFVPERRMVNLHFADGSHGTHVAGIAAGYDLFGKKGFHGIAPGARVMSLKIGDNTLAGGSTTTASMERALTFAAEWSTKNNTPVIANVSYGIGAELEGESDIDFVVDDLMKRHSLFVVATSAGNSGPGFSTVGTPAGAFLAFSTGALLTKANAAAQYAAKIGRDQIFFFSSRGGELAKPDGLCPGTALSQVPRWENWAVMRGTSMASPQAAGALALLASAAIQTKPALPFLGALAGRALRNSGRPLPGYLVPDQGAGVVFVPAAFESYRAIAGRPAATLVAGYRAQGDSPTSEHGYAFNAFFRAGTYVPANPESVSVRITPEFFASNRYPGGREEFLEVLDLWLEGDDFVKLPADSVFFRRDSGASLDVVYKPEKLKKPGVYTAILRGTPRELSKNKANTVFEMWHVVVVPYIFDLTNGFSRVYRKEKLGPGELRRYFMRVPEGAAGMSIGVVASSGSFADVNLLVFRPDGREFDCPSAKASSPREQKALCHVSGEQLEDGVWEVIAQSPISSAEDSTFDLDVAFSGFKVSFTDPVSMEEGGMPKGSFKVRPLFDQSFVGRATGGVFGVMKKHSLQSEGDRVRFPIFLDKDEVAVRVVIQLPKKDYARFTDIAVNVTDSNGEVVEKTGFSTRFLTFQLTHSRPGTGESFDVEIRGGLAKAGEGSVSWAVEEFHERAQMVSAQVRCAWGTMFQLYPGKTYDCEFELQEKPALAPSGYFYYGELKFRDDRSRVERFVVPLRFRLGE